ncbi:BslA/BslB family hydrophobin [Bacillus sp. FJAT-42315]|uniref:BslA/BslB family hydrophobin n=1 Tax=Bacillus sp. FJAT-42315 TaxID=2014077 RepID=UPI0012FF4030|nr:BslA/BslB family hydrophobin [Bacillus sp. FJAT-42315]
MVTKSATYSSGQIQMIRLDYFANTTFVNGTLTIQLPSEITVTSADSVGPFGQWRQITVSEISNNGHTLTFTGLNGNGDFALQLNSKVIPAKGSYEITVSADADGSGNSYLVDSEIVTLISQ